MRMGRSPTGAERYFAARHEDVGYHAAYVQASTEIRSFDSVISEVNERQRALGLDLDELAVQAGVHRRELRRLMSPRRRTARLETVTAVAAVLGLAVRLEPAEDFTSQHARSVS